MLYKILSYTSYALEFAGIIVGFAMYLRLPAAWKCVLVLVCAAFVAEVTALLLSRSAGDRNTHWVYNLYMLLDGPLLALAAIFILKHRVATVLGGVGLAVCYGLWLYQFILQPLTHLYTTAFVGQCVVLTVLYLAVPFRAVLSEDFRLGRSAILLCIANVLFSGGNIPRFGLFHYLNESGNWRFFAQVIPITNILAVLRYVLILAGFLSLPRISSRVSKSQQPA